jgi:hypothetical protein
MSRPKRQLESITHAITHGKEPERKFPATITLSRSQSLSLVALNNDEQRLRKQMQELNVALEATIKARIDVLTEIGTAHELTVEQIGQTYQFDGQNLVQPR